MAISLVVVSATPRATNSVSAARSTRALVCSAFPIASVYEGALIYGSWVRYLRREPIAGEVEEDRGSEDHTISAVEHAAVARDHVPPVLDAAVALDRRHHQAAHEAHQAQYDRHAHRLQR